MIPDVGADLIVHHDLAPWNLIASATGVRGFIDWDVAAPGTRLWDLAYAVGGSPFTRDFAWSTAGFPSARASDIAW